MATADDVLAYLSSPEFLATVANAVNMRAYNGATDTPVSLANLAYSAVITAQGAASDALDAKIAANAAKASADEAARPGDTMVPSVVTPATDLSGLATGAQADLIRDLLESDRAVDTVAKTITWYRRGTTDVLLTQTYDDVGTAQGVKQ